MNIQLYNECCLTAMKRLPDGCVDMVMADLPYGTTDCPWDAIIPLAPLWEQYRRLCRGAVVLTASQPFTTKLIVSNFEEFRYELIWDKGSVSGFALANKRPLKCHENILVFYRTQPVYNPQKTEGRPNNPKTKGNKASEALASGDKSQPIIKRGVVDTSGLKHPISIIYEKRGASTRMVHPTQKPVALMEYLIRTYTNEGQTVLDNTMGSGTTGVACMHTGRSFIGIERDPEYFAIAKKRIETADPMNPENY